MDSNSKTVKKRKRRSTKSRKIGVQGDINMAEARREIVNALQLHRQSSSSFSSSSASKSTPSKQVELNSQSSHKQSINHYPPLLLLHDNKSASSISNPLLFPEPTWSSTMAITSNSTATLDEKIEFEWPEIDRSYSSSSYSWWPCFLDSLDTSDNKVGCKKDNFKNNYYDFDYVNYDGGVNFDDHFMETSSNDQNPFADEWLIVPTADEENV